MQISISKFTGVMVLVVTVALTGLYGYFAYGILFGGDTVADVPTLNSINVSILGPRLQKVGIVLANTTDKIALKKQDIVFTESALFKNFTDVPGDIPLSGSRGRPDPFVPYVAP